MIRGNRPHQSGFTIIELIIVLTVSMALMSSAVLLFRGKIPRTQFQSAVNDFNTKLGDIANQVTAGNYPTQENFGCTAGGNISTDSADIKTQGTNEGCIFIGQVVQLGDNNGVSGACPNGGGENCDVINIYTVYGNTAHGTGIADSLDHANPKVAESVARSSYTLGYGTHIKKVSAPGILGTIGGIAYLQTFGSSMNLNSDPTGASVVDVVPLVGTNVGQTDFTSALNTVAPNPIVINASTYANPKDGIVICLKSGATDDYAVITIGKGGATALNPPVILTKSEGESDTRCV